jgi:hypothetical protein
VNGRSSVLALFAAATAAATPCILRNTSWPHDLASGYQAIACDVYADGKLELIALASNMSDLVWVENPAWERHVLARHLRRMISLACWSRTPYAPPIYRRRL